MEKYNKDQVEKVYQARSLKSSEYGENLAFMMLLILCAALIGNKLITSFVVSGALSLVYLLLNTLQSVWQSVCIWIVKQQMKDDEEIEDYPAWVSGGAWVCYYLKMMALIIAVVYFVKDVYYLF